MPHYNSDIDADVLLTRAGWLRYHDGVDGPAGVGSPLGRLIVHDASDRRDWEDEPPRVRAPVGAQVDQCMLACQIISQVISELHVQRKTRCQLYLIAATGWLSPDGRQLQFDDGGKLCAYLDRHAERIASRLPIVDAKKTAATWSFGDLDGAELKKRIKSRQKKAQRLKLQLVGAINRRLGRQECQPSSR